MGGVDTVELSPNGKPLDLQQIADALGVHASTISRRVRASKECLINQEMVKGKPARIVIGKPLPEEVRMLPTPAELEAAMTPPETVQRCKGSIPNQATLENDIETALVRVLETL